jgi:hypothetical protein
MLDNAVLDQLQKKFPSQGAFLLFTGGFLLEPYKTHRRVGAVFRRECPGIQTYFLFENKFRCHNLIYLLTKRRIGKTTRK